MLEAYYDTLRDEGIRGASLAKIAERIGIHDSLLVRYFGTKDQMTVELVQYMLVRYMDTYGVQHKAIADPRERLVTMVDVVFGPDYRKVVDARVWYAAFYIGLTEDSVRVQFRELWRTSLEFWEDTIARCMREGIIPEGDPRELAICIRAAEEGYEALCTAVDESERARMGDSLKRQTLRLLGLSAEG